MKFRHRRGGFEESMATQTVVNSMEELRAEIKTAHPTLPLGEVTFSYSGYDSRCNWNTWLVCNDGKAIGMSDTNHFGRIRWNNTKGLRETIPGVDNFLDEVIKVCKKHGMSISHEDTHGSFIVTPYKEWITEWFLSASIQDIKIEETK